MTDFLLRARKRFGRVQVMAYVGKAGETPQCCGSLTLSPEEWQAISHFLATGEDNELSISIQEGVAS